ncbi:hypothetical protein D9757_003964 [Collybiopsis confluens]|uniref:Uncharacterized protein n=1 Tax=Collybiopsis confluens TaxID=2823264 RepID=A0A8H5HWM9_9AGAR|nr:hypothetical protein D9757_003964 [Collybiopsis confluens]
MFSVDPKAFLVSLWVETFFFGLHLILFIFCVWVLIRHKREGYLVLLITAMFIISFSTTHVVLNFRDSIVRLHLEHNRHSQPDAQHVHWAANNTSQPDAQHIHWTANNTNQSDHEHWRCPYANDVENSMSFFGLNGRSFAYVMNNFFADALVVYRCYTLWRSESPNPEYFLAVPALLVLITTMVGVDGDPCKEALQLRPTFFVLALVTNLMVTLLAGGRLYWLTRYREWDMLTKNEPELLRRYRKAFMILIESGGLYSLTLALFLILCIDTVKAEGAALIVQSGLVQIMGIAPTSIIVIVGLGKEFSSQSDERLIRSPPTQLQRSSIFGQPSRKRSRDLVFDEVMNIA